MIDLASVVIALSVGSIMLWVFFAPWLRLIWHVFKVLFLAGAVLGLIAVVARAMGVL